MSSRRLQRTILGLVVVGLMCGCMVGIFGASGLLAERLGAGLGLGVLLTGFLPALLPVGGKGDAFSEVVGSTIEDPEERPPALRELEYATRFAILGSGGQDLHFRLRPVLRSVSAHLLFTRHGIEMDAAPASARELLGDELWDVVRPDRPAPPSNRGPGLPEASLIEMVRRLETL